MNFVIRRFSKACVWIARRMTRATFAVPLKDFAGSVPWAERTSCIFSWNFKGPKVRRSPGKQRTPAFLALLNVHCAGNESVLKLTGLLWNHDECWHWWEENDEAWLHGTFWNILFSRTFLTAICGQRWFPLFPSCKVRFPFLPTSSIPPCDQFFFWKDQRRCFPGRNWW